MPKSIHDNPKFKELLDQEYTWPCDYTFKFIVPTGQEDKVEKLFPQNHVQQRQSAKGNYVSLTINYEASSSDLIIAIYEKASSIQGLIAL